VYVDDFMPSSGTIIAAGHEPELNHELKHFHAAVAFESELKPYYVYISATYKNQHNHYRNHNLCEIYI